MQYFYQFKFQVSHLTGHILTNISATCSVYTNTDYLLVHDDQREDRIVAFILYITGKNGWNESKGGALQLLNTDMQGHAQNVVRNIYPSNNQLVLFQVTSKSYHQVIRDCGDIVQLFAFLDILSPRFVFKMFHKIFV